MKIKVDETSANQRFDRFLRKYFKKQPEIKLGDIFLRIRKWKIKVNGKKTKEEYRIQLNDEIIFDETLEESHRKSFDTLGNKEDKFKNLELKDISKYIIFEDENWIVFDKPAGIVAHSSEKYKNTLCMNDYLDRYSELTGIIGNSKDIETFKPSFGYRLDKDTSGVLIAGKNYTSLQYINEIIRDRKIDKTYYTIVEWKPKKEDIFEESLLRVFDKWFNRSKMVVSEEWQNAKTQIWTEKTIKHNILWEISLVKVKLFTGRMHQIRVHLGYHGFAVLWDIVYGKPSTNRKLYKQLKINRQILHCSEYSFKNIDGKQIKFSASLPADFEKILSN